MGSKIALFICCAMCSFGVQSYAQHVSTPSQTANPSAQSPSNPHNGANSDKEESPVVDLGIAGLIADNFNLKDTKKVSDLAIYLNKSVGYDVITTEDLMYPAIDLYGEDSWNTNNLNITTNGRHIPLPESYDIDCSQFSYPLDGIRRVNSNYGYRRRFGRMHYGIDLQLSVGDSVRAAFDGKVRLVDYDRRGYGKYVVVRHTNGLETLYGHLSDNTIVKVNDIVRAGEPIGLGGNTGRSTGPHLHFETRLLGQAINPAHLINFKSGLPVKEVYVYKRGADTRKTYASSRSGKSSSAQNGNIQTHRIKSGDTLSGIAARYGTSVNKLCQLNGINRNTVLRIGRTLRVSS
ncbi:MAG: M23 family metallopeptidase [Porphyromonas sp.]|nr:M23 family metallopeptidase [Porphyromonas sp.]